LKIKNILISQPEPKELEKTPYFDLIKKYDLNIKFHKFFKIEPLSVREFRKLRVNMLDYNAVIFTSKNSIDNFFYLLKELRVEMPESTKYFFTSESIALYIQKYIQYRKRKVFYPKQNVLELIELLKKNSNDKYILPCSGDTNNETVTLFEESKIKFVKAVVYNSVSNNLKDIDVFSFDLITLYSPNGVKSLLESYPNFKDIKPNMKFAGFGINTCQAIKDAGLKLEIEIPTSIAPSMTSALELYVTGKDLGKPNVRTVLPSAKDENADKKQKKVKEEKKIKDKKKKNKKDLSKKKDIKDKVKKQNTNKVKANKTDINVLGEPKKRGRKKGSTKKTTVDKEQLESLIKSFKAIAKEESKVNKADENNKKKETQIATKKVTSKIKAEKSPQKEIQIVTTKKVISKIKAEKPPKKETQIARKKANADLRKQESVKNKLEEKVKRKYTKKEK